MATISNSQKFIDFFQDDEVIREMLERLDINDVNNEESIESSESEIDETMLEEYDEEMSISN
jgi:hypothetical protein